jgi:NADH-quinone oxidoreductase subunit J
LVGTVLFGVFAVLVIASAIGVVTARNPVYSALFLVAAFVNSAVLWLLLEAEFLAIVLVLVYVGAVMVLFLFVVMMLDIDVARVKEGFTRWAPVGALVGLVIVGLIAQVLWLQGQGTPIVEAPVPAPPDASNTKELGAVLYTEHVYAFELAAVILLVAIVAAITLTMRRRPGLKVQDIAKQVAVRRADRVRLVKMDSEK